MKALATLATGYALPLAGHLFTLTSEGRKVGITTREDTSRLSHVALSPEDARTLAAAFVELADFIDAAASAEVKS